MINLNFGQAGCQIGDCLWDLLCREHDVSLDGELMKQNKLLTFEKLFTETNKCFIPKTMFIDLEPMVIQEIQKGTKRNLFSQNSFVFGKEDSANNYVRAHYTIGKKLVDKILNQIQKMTECCDKVDDFIITHALSGGTGSDFQDLILENIKIQFPKVNIINFSVFPSPNISTTVVEHLNAIQTIPQIAEHSNLVIALDNEALYNICENLLGIEAPCYTDINRIISVNISNLLMMRNGQDQGINQFDEIQNELMQNPNTKFCTSSIAPLHPEDSSKLLYFSVQKSITQEAMNDQNFLSSWKIKNSNIMSLVALYRGILQLDEILTTESQLPLNLHCDHAQPYMQNWNMQKSQQSCTILANSSSFAENLLNICNKFNKIYAKRAFVHWYVGEGISEGFFSYDESQVQELIKTYQAKE